MNKLDKYVADEVLPWVNDILELLNPTVAEIFKKTANTATFGAVDIFEILKLNLREQNFRKLLENIGETEELKSFISSANKKQKDFMMQFLIKTANLENDIQIFIMSRIVQSIKNNGELSYYESSLFTNINSLTIEDFDIFYKLYHIRQPKNRLFSSTFDVKNTHYYVALDKMINIGIISKPITVWSERMKEKDGKYEIDYEITEYSDTFFGYLKEYFETKANK